MHAGQKAIISRSPDNKKCTLAGMKSLPQGSQSAQFAVLLSAAGAPLHSAEFARDSINYLINYLNYLKILTTLFLFSHK